MVSNLARIGTVTGSFFGALGVAIVSTQTVNVITANDYQYYQQTGQISFTQKAPEWKPFGILAALGLTGVGCYHLWKILPQPKQVDEIAIANQNPQTLSPIQSGDKRLKQLWGKIATESPWLLQLMEPGPLLVWGGQGSGKTTFTGFLALLRTLFCTHRIEVNDPHDHLNHWPGLFPVYGSACNYREIDRRLQAYYDRVKHPTPESYTSIWDEVTQYSECCNPELAGRFLKSILSDSRKVNEHPILLSHNNTLGSLAGGKGGVKQMQIEGLVELHLFNKRGATGKLSPAMRGTIRGLELDKSGNPVEQQIELFSWMTPDYLYSIFPELLQQPEPEPEPETLPDIPTDFNQQFNSISWDYLISESTENEINKIIDSRRSKPETQPETVLPSETVLEDMRQPKSLQDERLRQAWDSETFSKYFPDTNEITFFDDILNAYDNGKTGREIIREVFKCSRSDGGNRDYSKVGKPCFHFLIRKYGTPQLIGYFAKFLYGNS